MTEETEIENRWVDKITSIKCNCNSLRHEFIGIAENEFIIRCSQCGLIQSLVFDKPTVAVPTKVEKTYYG